MSHRIDAIYENGVFRPDVPVNIPNGQRVSLDVERIATDIQHVQTSAEARLRFERCFGSVDLGQPIGIENSAIDTDLAREYRSANGPA
jgi:predicted DNA-binding antitoxin AbrB/MazE fold protein